MTTPPPTYDRAVSAYKAGKLEQAERLLQQIVARRHDYFDAMHLLADVQSARGKTAAALAHYERAIALQPDHAKAHYNRGVMLHDLKRFDEALTSYDHAIALRPEFPEAFNNRGNVLAELRRNDEALASYERALALRPDFPEPLNNRGVTLYDLRRFEEALASHDRSLALKGGNPEALNNRANALHALKRHDQALASYERALALAPDYAEAHWNDGLARLRLGDLRAGWRQYEWGWKAGHRGGERRSSKPRWTGAEPIAGKTLLLHAEQGIGDTIQFVRYAPLVGGLGARVLLEVDPSLAALLSGVPNVSAAVSRGKPMPAFDFHCPLLSLPLAFDTELASIPAQVPYLGASEAKLARWKDRLDRAWKARLIVPRAEGLRIGLAWSGRTKPDPDRSMALAQLAPLLDVPGIQFVSLQKSVRAGDEAALSARPGILHLGPELADFADTAAVIAQLDLVISIDTAVAHLAGALGKPVWILLPLLSDWRWMLDRDDSPWYPTARLFRQDQARAWEPVVARVRDALTTSRK